MNSNAENVALMTRDYREMVTSQVKSDNLLTRVLPYIDPILQKGLHDEIKQHLKLTSGLGGITTHME